MIINFDKLYVLNFSINFKYLCNMRFIIRFQLYWSRADGLLTKITVWKIRFSHESSFCYFFMHFSNLLCTLLRKKKGKAKNLNVG